MSIEKAIGAIKRHNRYLILSHVELEGDSLGSQFAFQILLKKLAKGGIIVNEEKPPYQYDFLDTSDHIITDLNQNLDYEAIAILDCPVIERIGGAKRLLRKGCPIINIDHHISNTNFGDINWVEPHTSSCGEMIYKLYERMNIPIDYRSALYLYVAILTDTGSFAYESTSSSTHTIAAELIKEGLKPNSIHQALYENKTMPGIKLLAEALSTITLTRDTKIAYMYVPKKLFNKLNLGLEAAEGFINYARSIKKASVAIIFLENPSKKDQIHISFRSKGDVDVNRLAALFGGGGHKNAAGCIIKNGLKETIKKVLHAVLNNI